MFRRFLYWKLLFSRQAERGIVWSWKRFCFAIRLIRQIVLKYRAACFLIENMPYYTYYKGKQLDRYFTYYALLQETRGLGISQVVADSVRITCIVDHCI